eukprot:199809-Chlamydomonas_euryale.AAC.3
MAYRRDCRRSRRRSLMWRRKRDAGRWLQACKAAAPTDHTQNSRKVDRALTRAKPCSWFKSHPHATL